jgi:hypothetical protein
MYIHLGSRAAEGELHPNISYNIEPTGICNDDDDDV